MINAWFRPWAAIVVCLLLLCGCNAQKTGGDPAAADDGTAHDSAADDNTAHDTGQPAATSDGEAQCDWTLAVDDTLSTKVNGYDFECTLTIHAVKIGGKDELGAYGGSASISYTYHMQNQSVSGDASGSGKDDTIVMEVVLYDAGQYADFEQDSPSPLAPVTACDAMALGSFAFEGTGLSQESSGGAQWSTQQSKTVSVPYKITVDGGQVTVELPSIAPGAEFTGMLTGTPR